MTILMLAAGLSAGGLPVAIAVAGAVVLQPGALPSAADRLSARLAQDGRQIAAYETAMLRYETALSNRLAPAPGAVPFIPGAQSHVWTWVAESQSVRRVAAGRFRISLGNCLDRLCAVIDCADAGWPVFSCSDGITRTMAAPDGSTIVFGGMTYMRPLPRTLQTEDGAPDGGAPDDGPKTKKPAAGGGAAGFN